MASIDKGKVIIIGVMALSVLVVGYMIVDYFSPETIEGSPGVKLSAPEIKTQRIDYDTKLEAYENLKEEEKENPIDIGNPFEVDFLGQDTASLMASTEMVARPSAPVRRESNTTEKEKGKQDIPEPEIKKKKRRIGFSAKKKAREKVVTAETIELLVRIGQASKVKNGSVIYMRTIKEGVFGKIKIPINTLIEGRVSLSGERLQITAEAVKVNGSIVANNLLAYDMQGIKGLAVNLDVENAIANDAINQGIDQAGRALNVPIISNLGTSSAKKAVNTQTVDVNKGGKFYLKTVTK